MLCGSDIAVCWIRRHGVVTGADQLGSASMTFEELDALYPNGFDDAYIDSVGVNYQNRTAELQLNLRRNPPGGPQ
jgi:hypothetical protein